MIKTWSAYSSALLLCLGLDVSTFADDSASASAEKQVAGIMAMDEQKLIALVPDQCPDIGVPCPKCKSHMRDMKAKWLWRVDEPNQVKCSKCDTIVPNIDYPMDKTCTYLNIRGERITVPYYHGPKPSGDLRGNPHPERYHFDGAIDNAHFGFTSRAVKDLANAYSLTKKDKYAHKALLILHEYSKKYPHYLCHRGRGINNYYVDVTRGCLVDGRLVNTGEDAPYGWTDTRMKKWWAAELDRDLWGSYRQVRSSPAADALSRELGTDVRRSIDGMIREMVDFIMLIPWELHMANNLTNFFADFADVGKLIGEPAFCHIPYRYCRSVLTTYDKGHRDVGYAYDLHNAEGTQGHYGVMARIYQVFNAIDGYSDPPGYVDRVTGKHLEDVSLAKDMPLFVRSIYTPEAYAVPSGRSNPSHDSMAYVKGGRGSHGPELGPLKESRCRLLPGYGHAVLGDGAGHQQAQVQLHFSSDKANHCHHDCLGLTWFAHDRELSGEIGYQRNILRGWSASTLTHNTVVVDQTEQPGSQSIGSLTLFAPELPGFTAVQVDGTAAYADQGVTLYRRTIVHVTTDPATPYFVDVFEVEGGSMHDYTLHGGLEGDSIGDIGLATQSVGSLLEPGQAWDARTGRGSLYGLFENIKLAQPDHGFHATFKYKDQPDCGSRIHVPRCDGLTAYLAESPALRKAGHYKDELVYNWKMPHLILRRRGDAGLRSVFVTVVDMFSGGSKITGVQRLESDAERIALRVDLGDRFDNVLITLHDANPTQVQLVSKRGAKSERYTIGSETLTGHITASKRVMAGDDTNAFVTPVALPVGEELRGSWMVVRHGGTTLANAYEIDRIERRGGATWIHLSYDHGLTIKGDEATEYFSSWRTFTGGETFTITRSTATVHRPTIEPNTEPWDALKMQRFIPFLETQTVTLSGGSSIRYTIDGRDPVEHGKTYAGPFTLDASATVKCVINNGIHAPRIVQQRFLKAIEPMTVDNAKPGLLLAEVDEQGKASAPRIVEALALDGYTSDLLAKDKDEMRFSGLIRIPADGIYTFRAQGGRGLVLTIGPIEVLDTRSLGPFKEWSAKVALKAGMHKLSLRYFGPSNGALNTYLDGPGVQKKPIGREIVFHAQ